MQENRLESGGYNLIMSEIRLDDIKHDPWGTSMKWLFALASVAHVRYGEVLPGYTPSRGLRDRDDLEDWDADYILALTDTGDADLWDISKVYRILSRFENWARIAERNY